MTRQQHSQHSPLSAPSSLSSRQRNISSPAGSNSNNRVRTHALLARLFRRKERSPPAPMLRRDATARLVYEEEEKRKTNVDSPMRALLRSLSLQRGGRNRPEVMHTPRAEALEVLVEGVLTELLEHRYWRSKPYYFVLEQTRESSSQVSFLLRQFQYLPESKKLGRLMTIITLSSNDVITDLRRHQQVKHALELQLAAPEQRTDINTNEREEEESSSQVIRLVATEKELHVKWFQILESCINQLIAQQETPSTEWRTANGVESAKIMPMPGDEEIEIMTMHFEQNQSAVSYTSSECSNNEHSDEEYPAEEIRAARQNVAEEEEDDEELKPSLCDVNRGSLTAAMEQLSVQRVGDYCCTPEYQSNTSFGLHAANPTPNEKTSRNQENNQGDNDSEKDFGMTSSVAPYKSAVHAEEGRWMYQRRELEGEYAKTRVRSPENGIVRGTFDSNLRLYSLVRPQTHSFHSNGQVFTLDTRYELIKPIGNGAYGAVIAVKDVIKDGAHFAVKKITNIFEDLVDAKRILREVRLLGHFRHKNITQLLDLAPPPSRKHFDDMYIITELMETDLHQVIYSMQPMSDDHVKYFLYQILCALHHIHSAGVLHRDMKPSNILLNANCDLKVCDFGLARGGVRSVAGIEQEIREQAKLTEYVVTRWYRAPEIMLNCLNYTTAIDVWAVGCIFAEMLLREPLFPGKDYLDQLKLIISYLGTPKQEDIGFVKNSKALRFLTKLAISKPKKWWDVFAGTEAESLVSIEAIDLLTKMLLFNPEKRISVDAALRHPYLATFFDENDLVVSRPFDFSFDLPDEELSREALIELFCEDIEQFHPPVPTSIVPVPLSSAASHLFRMGMTASAS